MTDENWRTQFHQVRMTLIAQQNQRLGQASMNALAKVNSPLYGRILNTDADPFYDDDKLPAFRKVTGLA